MIGYGALRRRRCCPPHRTSYRVLASLVLYRSVTEDEHGTARSQTERPDGRFSCSPRGALLLDEPCGTPHTRRAEDDPPPKVGEQRAVLCGSSAYAYAFPPELVGVGSVGSVADLRCSCQGIFQLDVLLRCPHHPPSFVHSKEPRVDAPVARARLSANPPARKGQVYLPCQALPQNGSRTALPGLLDILGSGSRISNASGQTCDTGT
jgi:hypothetical protein